MEITELKDKLEGKLEEYLNKYKIFDYINYVPELKTWKDYNIIEFEFKTTKKIMNFGIVESDFINQFINQIIDQLRLYTTLQKQVSINSRKDIFTKVIKPKLSNGINYNKIIMNSIQFYDLEYSEKIKYFFGNPRLFNFQKIDIIPVNYNVAKDLTAFIYDSSLITLNLFGDGMPELEIVPCGEVIYVKLYFVIDIYEQYVQGSNDINSIIKLNINCD